MTITLTAPGPVLNGTDGDDQLIGTPGVDTLDGKGGNDMLVGLAGADTLEGGAGIDTVTYRDSDARVEVSLVSGDGLGGHAEGDVLSGIENLDGSIYDDYLRGDAGNNVLRGGPGDDELLGYVGNDLLVGGPGADRIAGGDGIDTADYRNSDAAVIIDLNTDMGSGGHAEGDFSREDRGRLRLAIRRCVHRRPRYQHDPRWPRQRRNVGRQRRRPPVWRPGRTTSWKASAETTF